MPDKEKRKSNPRRRLLIRLLIGIAIFVALISAGIYALHPKGAQIVFIAPGDNGVSNIWLANLNNPENPRQLTYFEQDTRLEGFQTAETNETMIYILYHFGEYIYTVWQLDIHTGESEYILPCPANYYCNFSLHSDGEWILYSEFDEGKTSHTVYIYNLKTSEMRIVYEYFPERRDWFQQPVPRWLGHTDSLIFQADTRDDYHYIVYNFTEKSSTERAIFLDTLLIIYLSPSFSDDGSLVISSDWINSTLNFNYFDDELTPILETDILWSPSYIVDWHPDNRRVLVLESDDQEATAITLYDIFALTHEVLSWSSDQSVRYKPSGFNHDASQILYSKIYDNDEIHTQIMLYGMETGEEIALPLFGSNPQWVNGGR